MALAARKVSSTEIEMIDGGTVYRIKMREDGTLRALKLRAEKEERETNKDEHQDNGSIFDFLDEE